MHNWDGCGRDNGDTRPRNGLNGLNGPNGPNGPKKIKTIGTFETIKMAADNAVMPDLAMVLMALTVLKKSHNQICCQKGAECYTRQKCHRWVVLGVRPIGGIFC